MAKTARRKSRLARDASDAFQAAEKNSAAIQGPLSDCLSGCIHAVILMACILALNLVRCSRARCQVV